MGAVFSALALVCAGDAVCLTWLAGQSGLGPIEARRFRATAHIALFCGALCLIAARYAA